MAVRAAKPTMNKSLRNMHPDKMGHLRHTRMSELSTEVRAQNLAHSVALRKQLNEWYKEQHIAVHKLSHGQKKMFRNLIKVQNDKRRIERQTHIKKQDELRQKLRERAQKQKEEALKKAMELDMLSLAIGVTGTNGSRPNTDTTEKKLEEQKLPNIKEAAELSGKNDQPSSMGSKRKHERSTSMEPLESKRPTHQMSIPTLNKMNESQVLPAIQNVLKDYVPSQSDFDIIAAVSEANGIEHSNEIIENSKSEDISTARVPNTETSKSREIGARVSLGTPHFQQSKTSRDANGDAKNNSRDMKDTNEESLNTMWSPRQSRAKQRRDVASPNAVNVSIISDTSISKDLPELTVTKKRREVTRKKSKQSLKLDKDNESTNINLNSNQVLPPITSDNTNSKNDTDATAHQKPIAKVSGSHDDTKMKKRKKQKEKQALIDDMHSYHIRIADTRRYTLPDYTAPVVENVIKYKKTSEGSFVPSDLSVKPAAEDFKLPSKKSQYLLEKALVWEQGQVEPRQEKLENFYDQVSQHIDKSKRISIPKPQPVGHKDILPSIKLKPTIHSRTFGNSLEGFHLQQDVHDLQNCRYLRFKGTSLPRTLVDSDDDLATMGPDQIKITSWGHAEVSRNKPKHPKHTFSRGAYTFT